MRPSFPGSVFLLHTAWGGAVPWTENPTERAPAYVAEIFVSFPWMNVRPTYMKSLYLFLHFFPWHPSIPVCGVSHFWEKGDAATSIYKRKKKKEKNCICISPERGLE
jgi:hypothetical protein